jgi:hypothetical protein
MKEKLELLIANLNDDLKSIDKLKAEYDFFMAAIEEKEPDIYQRAVIGYYLHNFYNACENIFVNIAKTFENSIDPREWHKDILKRMKLNIEGIRPSIISESLYKILDDFRGFRHVFRHLYTFEIEWPKEKLLADKFETAVQQFKEEIMEFIKTIRGWVK